MHIGLVLIALAFPLLELAVLIKLGQTIGFWWTVLLLAFTSIVGSYIVHRQGLSALRRALVDAREGRPPIEPVVDSVLLMLAGTLLLVPGLITDVAAVPLLVPPLRRAIARWTLSRLFAADDVHVTMREAGSSGDSPAGQTFGGRQAPSDGIVIEGEWERVEDPKSSTPPGTAGNGSDRPPPNN